MFLRRILNHKPAIVAALSLGCFQVVVRANQEPVSALVFDPPGGVITRTSTCKIHLTKPRKGDSIRYTLDGSTPTVESQEVLEEVKISETCVINAGVFRGGLAVGAVERCFFFRVDANLAGFQSHLPILLIDNGGAGEPNGSAKQKALCSVFQGPIGKGFSSQDPPFFSQIQRRGTSSYSSPKFALKLECYGDDGSDEEKRALLGMPAESDWILSGRLSFDRTLIRNELMYQLSRDLGCYAPRSRLVEVFLKTDSGNRFNYRRHYMGVYSLVEKIKKGRSRVQLAKPNFSTKLQRPIMFKKDYLDPGDVGFEAQGFGKLAWVHPKEASLEAGEKENIKRLLSDLGTHARRHGTHEWRQRIDLNSWLTYHWLNVLAKNPDGVVASAYFSLQPSGGQWKIHAGPVWDFDRGLGSLPTPDSQPSGWSAPLPSSQFYSDDRFPIWGDLLKHPDFRQAHIDFWQQNRRGVFSLRHIDGVLLKLTTDLNLRRWNKDAAVFQSSAVDRNFLRWSQFPPKSGSHLAEVESLKAWIKARMEWIDQQLVPTPKISNPKATTYQKGGLIRFEQTDDEVYFTLNGSDPRLPGGKVSPLARKGGPFPLEKSLVVTARSRRGTGLTSWSGPMKRILVVKEAN